MPTISSILSKISDHFIVFADYLNQFVSHSRHTFLTRFVLLFIKNPEIRQLIIDEYITISQLINFERITVDALENKEVLQFIRDQHITKEQCQTLTVKALNALGDIGVREFIIKNHITIERFQNLSAALEALENKEVRQFIMEGHITIEQFKKLSIHALNAIRNQEVREFIIKNHINMERFQNLSEALAALENKEVRQFIMEGHISIVQFQYLNKRILDAIENSLVREFFITYHILIIRVQNLSDCALNAIENSEVREFIINNNIDIVRCQNLNNALEAIGNPEVRKFVIYWHITIKQFQDLSTHALKAITSQVVREFIINEGITIEQFQKISDCGLNAITNKLVRQFIRENHITIATFQDLIDIALQAIENFEVREFIIDGHITIEQFQDLGKNGLKAIQNRGMRELIIDKHLAIEQCQTLDYCEFNSLLNDGVQQMIRQGRVTMEQIARVNTLEKYYAIIDKGNVERILNNQLDVGVLIGDATEQENDFNNVQNTHTTTINVSTSSSANNLNTRYGDLIKDNDNLNEVIESLKESVLNYNDKVEATYNDRTRDCLPAAKACIERLTANTYDFKDEVSKLSILQLLALTCLAMRDKNCLINCTEDDVMKFFIIGLYEIERGNNIEKKYNDIEELPSSYICEPGTFNKLIEKLIGMHVDCSLIFITRETLTSKMRIIVSENIAKYIESASTDYKNKFDELCASGGVFSDNEWVSIWAAIKDEVLESAQKEHFFENINDKTKVQITQWIEDNMDGFSSPQCLLNKTDMLKIKTLLSASKPAQQFTPGYSAALASAAAGGDEKVLSNPRPKP